MRLAAAVDAASLHPVAPALLDAARTRGVVVVPDFFPFGRFDDLVALPVPVWFPIKLTPSAEWG